MIAVLPFSRTRWMHRMYTSVLPLPVTPCSRKDWNRPTSIADVISLNIASCPGVKVRDGPKAWFIVPSGTKASRSFFSVKTSTSFFSLRPRRADWPPGIRVSNSDRLISFCCKRSNANFCLGLRLSRRSISFSPGRRLARRTDLTNW